MKHADLASEVSASQVVKVGEGGSFYDTTGALPCVLFDATPTLEVISITESISDLLGLSQDAVIGRPSFWQDTVVPEDWPLFREKVSDLDRLGAVSFIHRVSNRLELPVWVTHSLRRLSHNGKILVRGCLVPVGEDPRMLALDQQMISRFIHKLGNHFQLLNLVINSLHNSKEGELLQESLDKAIDLARVFSDCNHPPSWMSKVQLLEVLQTVFQMRCPQFVESGVCLETDFAGIRECATILSDPYLLEASLGQILLNALEATAVGGKVDFGGRLIIDGTQAVARLFVRDNGCGIPAGQIDQLKMPFYTTKKGHEGLGLTMASRLIEMHRGLLRIKSQQGSGTEVEILLPIERAG